MTINKKKTSSAIASQAAQTLQDSRASKTARSLAASALSQTGTKKQTGAAMETLASTVLNSNKYNTGTKSLAGTVLAQANKIRKSK